MPKRLVLLFVMAFFAANSATAEGLKSDEEAIIIPTAAWLSKDGLSWQIPLHLWVFEPEEDSLTRNAILDGLANLLELSGGRASESEIFRERARPFLQDNERGKALDLKVGDYRVPMPETGANGRAEAVVSLPSEDFRVSTTASSIPVRAILKQGDSRAFEGQVHFIGLEGLSVISDIDDTIKISHVVDKRLLLERTFLKPFEEAPGMAELYRDWANSGAAFHYLSSSPWQLYPALSDFMAVAGFPAGSFHLRGFRLKDESFFNLFKSSMRSKPPVIKALLARYPGRRFILVGDSGEVDPEIYGEIARHHGDQIAHIFIRLVTREHRGSARMEAALRGLPASLWSLFEEPSVLPHDLAKLVGDE